MNRRLLLTLAGLGASAAAVFLMSGTAHALAPPPTPVHLTIPKPPAVATVKTVTTEGVHEVKQAAPVKQVATTVPVVVKRLTGTLDQSLAAPTAVPHRSLAVAPNPLRVARSSRPSEVRASAFASTGSPRTSTQMQSTRTRPASHHSTPAFAFAGLSDTALSPAQSSVGSPFASIATRTPFTGTATRWLTFPTADRTRPGFLVGSARPG
jgi:hypothetical protein